MIEWAFTVAVIVLFMLIVSLYSLILVVRGILRTLERERNAHNAQVSELLDRLAHAEGRPWTLPPRPVEPVSDEPEQIYHDWREV